MQTASCGIWRSFILVSVWLAGGGSRLVPVVYGQHALEIRPAEPIHLPFVVDSNSPMFWRRGRLHLYSSSSHPRINVLDPRFRHISTEPVVLNRDDHIPMWIESVWQDRQGGIVYGWYHHERSARCPNNPKLTVPEIGALISYDGGKTFRDLGIVLSSGEFTNCSAKNGYFATGHGDFSVIADRSNEYFYFVFGAYGGDVSRQGVAIARMPFGAVHNPVGTVRKYYRGAWSEPGLGGRVTPVFSASVGWGEANTDSFWGPSIHWNTYLQRYVVLMNRSCCGPEWPQEGIYITMNADLAEPAGWTQPEKIIEYGDWYPWVMGMGRGETSAEAGQRVRLFVRQTSEWEIVFHLKTDPQEPPP